MFTSLMTMANAVNRGLALWIALKRATLLQTIFQKRQRQT
jgi:hypothetical protein